MSLAIKNGLAFTGGEFIERDILVENGAIAAIGHGLKGDENLNAAGMLVLPGLIDPHVHLREPGDTRKEDFATGGRAAIAGGFTTVMDMPNNAIPTVTKARYDEKINLAKKALCDVFFHFGGTDDNFEEVKKADPPSLKLYLGKTTGMLLLKDPGSMERHFAGFPKSRPVVLHACDHSGNESENLQKTCATVENAVSVAQRIGRRIHLAHASTAKEVQLAKRYPGCTVETAPHYLFLSTKDSERLGAFQKVYPPLRSDGERKGLWAALAKIDCIATDHAPHTAEDKEKGAAGFPGLETSLALMLDACNKGLFDRAQAVRMMSENVAAAFNLGSRGRLENGCVGDITIVDYRKTWTVEGAELQTKCKWSPFEGKELKGKAHSVIKGGELVYQEYEFVK